MLKKFKLLKDVKQKFKQRLYINMVGILLLKITINLMKKASVIRLAVLLGCLGLMFVLFSTIMTKRSVEVVFSKQAQYGAEGPVRLSFTQPMDKTTVEERIRIEPDVKIWFNWVENDLFIWPQIAFASEDYQLVLEAGSKDKSGALIETVLAWSFSIREPELVFLYPANGSSELYKTDLTSGSITQMTRMDGRVYDYSVSKSGEVIVFSVTNAVGGKDIWVMDRDGSEIEKLVSCGKDECFEPVVRPGDIEIAYSKQASESGMTGAGSKIWLVDLSTKKTVLLVDDPTINGSAAEWSPLGDRLAFLDEVNELIRVFDIANKEITNLRSSGMEIGAWSPDGSKMIIPSVSRVGVQAFSGLGLVDFKTESVEPLFTQAQNRVDYFTPDYSSSGDQIIVGRREQLINGRANIQIWLVDLATKKLVAITTDQNYSHGGFHWNPGGEQVVYQRFSSGNSKATPEIFVWDRTTGDSRLIVENAAIPQWLP